MGDNFFVDTNIFVYSVPEKSVQAFLTNHGI
jgi:hypothetical protein